MFHLRVYILTGRGSRAIKEVPIMGKDRRFVRTIVIRREFFKSVSAWLDSFSFHFGESEFLFIGHLKRRHEAEEYFPRRFPSINRELYSQDCLSFEVLNESQTTHGCLNFSEFSKYRFERRTRSLLCADAIIAAKKKSTLCPMFFGRSKRAHIHLRERNQIPQSSCHGL